MVNVAASLFFRFILRSSVKGFYSAYSPSRGSFLIQAFCEEAAKGREIDQIRREIAARARRTSAGKLTDSGFELPSVTHNTLTKRLVILPKEAQ